MVLSEEQLKILEYYEGNCQKNLKAICRKVWLSWNLPNNVHDDLYANASDVLLEIINTYDEDKAKFETYLTNCIANSARQWIRDNYYRAKRNNLVIDRKTGKIAHDENGNSILLKNTTWEEEVDKDGIPLSEKIAAKEKEEYSENLIMFLDTLNPTERQMADLVMDGYKVSEAKDILNITDSQCEKILYKMRKHRNIFNSSCPDVKEKKMVENGTFEKSKTDKLSVMSIMKKIDGFTLRTDHPLQRESEQWASLQMGNLVSDILQGNPLPPLIFAEQIINGFPVIWVIDGKQRCMNAYNYIKDEYKVSNKVRRPIIQYQSIVTDESGNPILTEDGIPEMEMCSFDIRKKKFSQLPNELKDKFMDYCFNYEQYINCSADDLAYHIARYNDGKPMNTQQKGFINIGEKFAPKIKSIAAMPFFTNCDGYKKSEMNNGTINRTVIEGIMATYFLKNWNKDFSAMCNYIQKNATSEMFGEFEDLIEQISDVFNGRENDFADFFNSKDSFLWFALFNKFTKLGLDNARFVEFLESFRSELHSKKINGNSYDDFVTDETGKARPTKDAYIVLPKMETLFALMDEYFDVKSESVVKSTDFTEIKDAECNVENIDEISEVLSFVKENIDMDTNESDIELFNDMVCDCVKVSSAIYQKCKSALIAIMAYACKKENDAYFEKWVRRFDKITDFSSDINENYTYFKRDFDDFAERVAVA